LSFDSPFRRLVRATVPFRIRRVVHEWRAQPFKIRDLLPDLVDRIRVVGPPPLPPPVLRGRVSWTTSRREFQRVGKEGSSDVEAAFAAARRPGADYGRWLDFGCGCGRMSRHLAAADPDRRLTGVDVDRPAVSWAAGRLRGRFFSIEERPPIALPPASFDVAVAVSVFTHLGEDRQREWREELHRLIRPGGLLIATTLPPHLVSMVPNLAPGQSDELNRRGFLYAPGPGPFNQNAAFHSRKFLEETWQPLFRLVDFRPAGMTKFQDLSVWEA
jgi:SAM-dependent methyltransferase